MIFSKKGPELRRFYYSQVGWTAAEAMQYERFRLTLKALDSDTPEMWQVLQRIVTVGLDVEELQELVEKHAQGLIEFDCHKQDQTGGPEDGSEGDGEGEDDKDSGDAGGIGPDGYWNGHRSGDWCGND